MKLFDVNSRIIDPCEPVVGIGGHFGAGRLGLLSCPRATSRAGRRMGFGHHHSRRLKNDHLPDRSPASEGSL